MGEAEKKALGIKLDKAVKDKKPLDNADVYGSNAIPDGIEI
jgi:hypothetical protein